MATAPHREGLDHDPASKIHEVHTAAEELKPSTKPVTAEKRKVIFETEETFANAANPDKQAEDLQSAINRALFQDKAPGFLRVMTLSVARSRPRPPPTPPRGS